MKAPTYVGMIAMLAVVGTVGAHGQSLKLRQLELKQEAALGFGAERSISLKDGALDYKINFTSVNDDDFVFEFLQNNL